MFIEYAIVLCTPSAIIVGIRAEHNFVFTLVRRMDSES